MAGKKNTGIATKKRSGGKRARKALSYDSPADEISLDGAPQPGLASPDDEITKRQPTEDQNDDILKTPGPKTALRESSSTELFRVSCFFPSPGETPPRPVLLDPNCDLSLQSRQRATSTPKPGPEWDCCDPSFSEQSSSDERFTDSVSSIIDSLSKSITPSQKQRGLLANMEQSDILKGVRAFVEVRSGTEDISVGLVELLKKLGATVLKSMGRTATHVVFRQGRVSTRNMALKWKIPLVSPLWVETCRIQKQKVPEAPFFAKVSPDYDCPILSKKIRKPKSWRTTKPLQPVSEILNKSPALQRSSTKKRSPRVAALKVSHSAKKAQEAPSSLPIGLQSLATVLESDAHKPSSPRTPQHRRSLRTELLKLNAETFKKRNVECTTIAEHSAENVDAAQLKDADEQIAAEEVDKQPCRRQRRLFSEQAQEEAGVSFIIAKTPPATNHVSSFLDEEDEELVPLSERLGVNKVARREEAKQDDVDNSLLQYIRRYRIANSVEDSEESNAEESRSVSAISHYNRKKKREKTKSSETQVRKKRKTSSCDDKPEVKKIDCGKADPDRRSSLEDFVPNIPPKKRPKSLSWLESSFEDCTSSASIVLTSVKPSEEEMILGIVKGLGRFRIEERVSASTTHLVCGDKKRTLNMLFALAQGCWVLSPKWVTASLEAGEWVGEEDYELSDYFPAVRLSRMEKQATGNIKLFDAAGFVYVSPSSVPRCNELRLLVERAGGKVAQSYLRCDIAAGPVPQAKRCGSVVHVSEKWILDSISEHRMLPLEDYLCT